MEMELIDYNEDTGVMNLNLDEEAKNYLIELGMNALLKRAINEMIEEHEDEQTADD